MKKSILGSVIAITVLLMAISCDNAKKDDTANTTETDTVVVAPPDTAMADGTVKVLVTREEVPEKAVVAFNKKVPAAKNVQYSRVTRIDPGPDTVYYYYFDYDRNDYSYWLVYDEEGKVVEDNSYVKIGGLPDPVSRSIAEYFPGYKVMEIDKDNDKDIVQYEVQMERGEMKKKVKFLSDGGIYKLKTGGGE